MSMNRAFDPKAQLFPNSGYADRTLATLSCGISTCPTFAQKTLEQSIVSITTHDQITISAFTTYRVITGASSHYIVTFSASDIVITKPSIDYIVSFVAVYIISARSTINPVVSF